MNNNGQRKRIKWDHILIWILVLVLTIWAVRMILTLIPEDNKEVDNLLQENPTIIIETETEPPTEENTNYVPKPEIDEQHLTINEYSRPGEKVKRIEKIVIHYLGNPNTSAQQNHDYFESLKDLKNTSMSANFVVGIDGEIIECVPPGEVAYASNSMNPYSISIENCHLESSGRFTEATYRSTVQLAAWLLVEYNLEREDIIRHFDVTGKDCPKYYVEHEDKWEAFRDEVMAYVEECRIAAEKEQ